LRKEIIKIKNEFYSILDDREFFTSPQCDKNKIIDAIKEFSLKSSLLYSVARDDEAEFLQKCNDVKQSMNNLSKFIPDIKRYKTK